MKHRFAHEASERHANQRTDQTAEHAFAQDLDAEQGGNQPARGPDGLHDRDLASALHHGRRGETPHCEAG